MTKLICPFTEKGLAELKEQGWRWDKRSWSLVCMSSETETEITPEIIQCSKCRFYAPVPTLPEDGFCHRNPELHLVTDNHWCGEFKPKRQFESEQ